LETKKLYNEAMQEEIRGRNSREGYDLRQQKQISDLKHELEDAKLTVQKLGDKNRELERGYGFKPNPVESALRLEIGDLRSELEAYKQQPDTDFELPEPADLLNQLKGLVGKKCGSTLRDMQVVVEILRGEDG
jgi:hypothetical protein